MKDSFKYSNNPKDTFNYLQFDYATNTFIGPLMMDCSGFTACVMHVMGDSPADKPYTQEQYAGNENGYKFKDKYKPGGSGSPGPSNQGNNATLFNFGKTLSKTDILKMINNNDVAGLKKLEGKIFVWNDNPCPYTDYTTYSHTGIIGPYNEKTKSFTIYDSNDASRINQNGIADKNKITVDLLKFLPHLDVLEFN